MVFRVLKRVLLKGWQAESWPVSKWLGEHDLPPLYSQFISVQVLASVMALCAFPIWILWQATLTVEMVWVFGWLVGPLAAAVVLIRSGSITAAFAVSSISFTGLICTICILTGGLQSFALIWLLAVPFEAMVSRDKRIICTAILVILLGGGLLAFSGTALLFDIYPPLTATDPLGFILGPFALALYIAVLAMKMQTSNEGYQERMKVNEARYRLLAENTSDLIIQYDVSGNVVFASPATRTLLGVESSYLKNKSLIEHVHIADRPEYMQALSNVVARGMPSVIECRLKVRLDGCRSCERTKNIQIKVDHDYAWVEMRIRPIWNSEDEITGIISTTSDVTKRRMREEELHRMHRDIKELNDAKGRFLANMSHELRTPLNAIIGFSDILGQELFGKLQNEKQKEYVGLIHESGNHLLQVVTDILDMSKIDSGTFDIVPEPFDVKSLIETCTGMLSQQAEMRDIELRTIVPDDLPEAVADSRACRQILINLISNALKFSNQGDRVTIGVRLEGDNLAYFVRDNGIGMSKNDLDRIGQPFFQADSALDRRYEGTGLGVSVVKGLTKLHKGYVTFESELGKGTCVTVFIPLQCGVEQITVQQLSLKTFGPNTVSLGKDAENTVLEKIA